MMDRYSRQELLPEIGEAGQRKLAKSHVAIVGVGALGSVAAELLCRAGIGKLTLIDDDTIELSNLQRQGLYTEKDLGVPKVEAAQRHLTEINSEADVQILKGRMRKDVALEGIDLLLDCTDNLDSRFLLNEYAFAKKIPCVFCMVVQTKGMLYVVDPSDADRACYNCIFDQLKSIGASDELGVLNTTTHFAATLQAGEAMKLLLGKESTKGLINFDVWDLGVSVYGVQKKKRCLCRKA